MYDPVELAERLEGIVAREGGRKYYRFRPARFYGGIATADCVGCNLSCIFCWSLAPRRNLERVGHFYSPEEVFSKLDSIARKHGYSQIRVSGNEPTIGRQHLLHLLELVDAAGHRFILETNGVMLGADAGYVQKLAKFQNLHVRVSLKGCDGEQFSQLTGAKPEAFDLQLAALHNLLDAGVSCHAAVMEEFAPEKKLDGLKRQLALINRSLVDGLEFEHLIPFPHVIRELEKRGIQLKNEDIKTSIERNY